MTDQVSGLLWVLGQSQLRNVQNDFTKPEISARKTLRPKQMKPSCSASVKPIKDLLWVGLWRKVLEKFGRQCQKSRAKMANLGLKKRVKILNTRLTLIMWSVNNYPAHQSKLFFSLCLTFLSTMSMENIPIQKTRPTQIQKDAQKKLLNRTDESTRVVAKHKA